MLEIATIFPEAAIEPAAAQPPQPPPDRAFGLRGAAAPHIVRPAPAEIEDADSAEIGEETDPEDHLADDLADEAADTDADGGPLRYLAPSRAAKLLRSHGLDIDLAELRRLVAGNQGPPVAKFEHSAGQGGWRIRQDQLEQWLSWQRFQAAWAARGREAAA